MTRLGTKSITQQATNEKNTEYNTTISTSNIKTPTKST
jgi:hypothetical protein